MTPTLPAFPKLARTGRVWLIVLALLADATPAQAAFPGANGKLYYVATDQIFSMNADGTGITQLTSDYTMKIRVNATADGTKLAFLGGDQSVARVSIPTL